MVGPIEHIGPPTDAPAIAPRPKPQVQGADFADLLRRATSAAPASPTPAPLPAAPPVDLSETLERMQRVSARVQQARAYFHPPATTPLPGVDAEA